MTRARAREAAERVQHKRDHEGLGVREAKLLVARDMGLSPSTVNRYLREAKWADATAPVSLQRKYRVSPLPKKRGGELRVVAIGDMHDAPSLDPSRFGWIGSYIRETDPDMAISIGDMLTMDSLNQHARNDSYEGRLKPTFVEDMESGADALHRFNEGLGSWDGQKHITLGNHEYRIERYADQHPEVFGLMQDLLFETLDNYGWTYSPFGEVFYVGGVGFVHVPLNEMGKPYGGKTAETRVANDTLTDLVFGHSHRARVHHAAKIGGGSVKILNLGSALPSGHVEDYARHSAHGWTYGIFDLTLRGGRIAEHEFISMETLEGEYGV